MADPNQDDYSSDDEGGHDNPSLAAIFNELGWQFPDAAGAYAGAANAGAAAAAADAEAAEALLAADGPWDPAAGPRSLELGPAIGMPPYQRLVRIRGLAPAAELPAALITACYCPFAGVWSNVVVRAPGAPPRLMFEWGEPGAIAEGAPLMLLLLWVRLRARGCRIPARFAPLRTPSFDDHVVANHGDPAEAFEAE